MDATKLPSGHWDALVELLCPATAVMIGALALASHLASHQLISLAVHTSAVCLRDGTCLRMH
eukprot:4799807-Pyramimonas_sp.AAC.1